MAGKELSKLPELVPGKKVFFMTQGFPPMPAGTSVINRNLLANFDRDSFVVLACRSDFKSNAIETGSAFHVEYIFRYFLRPYRLNRILYPLQMWLGLRKTMKLAKKHKPACLVAVYPDHAFLKMAREAALRLKLPLVAYFHDTLAESASGTSNEAEAKILQDQVFTEAKKIFVMSEGMRDLYLAKYKLETTALEHTYPEPIPATLPRVTNPLRQALWGGDIYAINQNAVKRLSNALQAAGTGLFVATNKSVEYLAGMGISGPHLKRGFFSKRHEYLGYLSQNQILLLGLDWPDESTVHEDELATIFPTKTPEYLASGRIILVHCPEHYFLSRFFKKHACGVVVNERDGKAVQKVIEDINAHPERYSEISRNALKAAHIFEKERLVSIFQSGLKEVVR